MNAIDTPARKPPLREKTLIQIFFWPLLIGIATGAGLVGALLEDGLWDALFCTLLTIPVVVCAFFSRRRD